MRFQCKAGHEESPFCSPVPQGTSYCYCRRQNPKRLLVTCAVLITVIIITCLLAANVPKELYTSLSSLRLWLNPSLSWLKGQGFLHTSLGLNSAPKNEDIPFSSRFPQNANAKPEQPTPGGWGAPTEGTAWGGAPAWGPDPAAWTPPAQPTSRRPPNAATKSDAWDPTVNFDDIMNRFGQAASEFPSGVTSETQTGAGSAMGWGNTAATAATAAAGAAVVISAAMAQQRLTKSAGHRPLDRTLYIAMCPDDITEEMVRYHFRELGEDAITQVEWNMRAGIFQGSGYVHFSTKEKAMEASMYAPLRVGRVSCLHRLLSKLHMEQDDTDMAIRDARTIFHGQCPDSITDQHFYDYYGSLAPDAISGIRWGTYPDGRFKNFGFVEFKTVDLARKALELPPLSIDGALIVRERNGTGGKMKMPLKKARQKAKQLLSGSAYAKGKYEFRPSRQIEWTAEAVMQRPFRRNFSTLLRYTNREQAEIDSFITTNKIATEGGDVRPILDFNEIDLGAVCDSYLRENFTAPKPVQSVAWPGMLSGRDLMVVAPPASGKTLAYTMPCLVSMMAQGPAAEGQGPSAIILAASREAVLQIYRDLDRFQVAMGIQIGVAHGGEDPAASRYVQGTKLVAGCEILIATPGRLLDFVEAGVVPVDRTVLVVVDEAEKLLSRSLIGQLRLVLQKIRPDRQMALFASNLSMADQREAEGLMYNPLKVVLGQASYPPVKEGITQRFIFPEGDLKDKEDMLVDMMREIQRHKLGTPEHNSRMLVYINTRDYLKGMVRGLQYLFFFRVQALAEGMTQLDRVAALSCLNMSSLGILVATDVVSRSWEINELAYVINFELPTDIVTYIDRINHLGVDNPGIAISFFTAADEPLAPDLVKVLQASGQEVPQRLLEIAARNQDFIGGLEDPRRFETIPNKAPWLTEKNEDKVIDMKRQYVQGIVWPEEAASQVRVKSSKEEEEEEDEYDGPPDSELAEEDHGTDDEGNKISPKPVVEDDDWLNYSASRAPLFGYEGGHFDGGRMWTSDY